MTDDVELQSPSVSRNTFPAPRLFSAAQKKPNLFSEPDPEQRALEELNNKQRDLLLERAKVCRMPKSDAKNDALDKLREDEQKIISDIARIREIKHLKEFSLTKKPAEDRHIARRSATQLSSQILRANPELRSFVHCALALIHLESHLFTFGNKAKRRAGFAMLAALSALQNSNPDIRSQLVTVKYLGRRKQSTLFANNGVAKLLNDFQSGKRSLNEQPLSAKEKSSRFLYG